LVWRKILTTKVKEIDNIGKEFELEGYTLLTKEYENQKQKLEYICPNGHKRHTTWKSWKKGSRCLVCKNQSTKPSIDVLRIRFEEEGYILLPQEYKNNKTKLDYICPNGHNNSITWADWNSGGYRCPDCANNKKLDIERVILDFNSEGYTFISGEYTNNVSVLIVKCTRGHEFETSRVKWTAGNRCPICYFERINIQFVKESFEDENYKLLSNEYIDAHSKLKYICSNGHEHEISWAAWQQGERCYHCRNLKHRVSIKEIKKMFEVEDYVFVEDSYLKSKLEYICPEGHEGSVSLGNWKTNRVRCPVCGNNGTSIQEQDLIDHIEDLNVDIDIRNRSIIKPKELDVVIHSKKIAIEYCGLYWHSELMDKNNDYHVDKLEKCNENGYKLLTIFEDEWINKKEIVLSRLKNILGYEENIKTLYARKLSVREIDTLTVRQFCEENHLQGYTGSSIKLGAFYEDELVSVMTFSKPSISKGQGSYDLGVWELSRFCSKLNYKIVGVASKLLSYFKKNYEWKQVFSYADRRWSTGNLYNKLGFEFIGETKSNYWYFANGSIERHHRFALRKKPDEPKDITEWELRKAQGWNRIWDCGNLKYVMHNK
jgi:hypothetical protein